MKERHEDHCHCAGPGKPVGEPESPLLALKQLVEEAEARAMEEDQAKHDRRICRDAEMRLAD